MRASSTWRPKEPAASIGSIRPGWARSGNGSTGIGKRRSPLSPRPPKGTRYERDEDDHAGADPQDSAGARTTGESVQGLPRGDGKLVAERAQPARFAAGRRGGRAAGRRPLVRGGRGRVRISLGPGARLGRAEPGPARLAAQCRVALRSG